MLIYLLQMFQRLEVAPEIFIFKRQILRTQYQISFSYNSVSGLFFFFSKSKNFLNPLSIPCEPVHPKIILFDPPKFEIIISMFHFSVIVKSCLFFFTWALFFFLKKQGLVKIQLNFIIIFFQYRNIILKYFVSYWRKSIYQITDHPYVMST